MSLQLCKKYPSYGEVLSLRPLHCKHGNMTLKFHQKNSYLNEGWLSAGRLKVGSLPRMINKEELAQYICKPI